MNQGFIGGGLIVAGWLFQKGYQKRFGVEEGCPLCGKACKDVCEQYNESVNCKCGKRGWSCCEHCEQVTCEPHTLSKGSPEWEGETTICPDCSNTDWDAESFSADAESFEAEISHKLDKMKRPTCDEDEDVDLIAMEWGDYSDALKVKDYLDEGRIHDAVAAHERLDTVSRDRILDHIDPKYWQYFGYYTQIDDPQRYAKMQKEYAKRAESFNADEYKVCNLCFNDGGWTEIYPNGQCHYHPHITYEAQSFNADLPQSVPTQSQGSNENNPVRIIVGGPPHSGKSTLMHLLEDKLNAYGVSVEMRDLDLSSPTGLREGWDVNREKRDWTPELAQEAAALFREDAKSRIVLGDSIGLVSMINEIVSEPADVAILLVSGSHGDDDDTFREQIGKWRQYYGAIDKPILMVIRSTMNPEDKNFFDPHDNYGVFVGLDRDAYTADDISLENACLEGMVFEIAQEYDLGLSNDITPSHKEEVSRKWPEISKLQTWQPPAKLAKIESDYLSGFEAESFGADGAYLRKSNYGDDGRWGIFWEGNSRYRNYGIILKDNPNDLRIVVDYDANAPYPYALSTPQPDRVIEFSNLNEVLEYLDDNSSELSAYAHDGGRMRDRSRYPTVGDWTWYEAEEFGVESFSKRHNLESCVGCGEVIQDISDTCPDCELGPPDYAERHHGYECCPHS